MKKLIPVLLLCSCAFHSTEHPSQVTLPTGEVYSYSVDCSTKPKALSYHYTDAQLESFGVATDDFCGPKKYNTGQQDEFAWQCVKHDMDYLFKKDGDPFHRREVDNLFYTNMLNHLKITGKWWFYPKAKLYYAMVKAVGFIWWSMPKGQTCTVSTKRIL